MKSLLTILAIIVLKITFSQNYLDYYKQINKAKLLAANSNYLESAILFKKVFEKYDFEFTRDCINAFEVSSNLNNDSLTFYFIKCSLKGGVPISYFDNKKMVNFKSSPFWRFIMDSSSIYQKTYQAKINTKIRGEINKMFEDDQLIREKYYKWHNFLFRPIINMKWKKLNKKQVERIIQITKEYGFPGERIIGIDLPQYHKKIDSLQFSAGMPIILFIHHYSKPNFSFDSILLEEVFKGNLYNEHFATIVDFEAEFGKNKFSSFGYYGLRHKPKNYIPNEFYEKRKKIGLISEFEIQNLNKSYLMTKFWNRLK